MTLSFHVKRILFRVDAQPEIGFGHFFRCMALANMIADDFKITFGMGNPDSVVRQILSDANYSLIILKPFDYSFPDNRENEEVEFDLEDHIESFDIVVIDGYWFGSKYQSELRSFEIKVVTLEDNGCGHYKTDVLINQAEGLSINEYNIDNNEAKILLGSNYALLRSPFLKAALDIIALDERRDDYVFVCFGGSDIVNKTLEVSKWFLDNTSVKLHVVVGNAYPYIASLEELRLSYSSRLILFQGLTEEEMVEEMSAASVGVIPASGILLEAIACRLPVISGVYAQNQMRIYKGFLKQGVLIPAPEFKPNELKRAWSQFNEDRSIEIIKNQIKLFDGRSDERIRKVFQALC